MGGVISGVLLLLALGSCNPIETYRNWRGVSANDPNPETTPNTKNLAAGEAQSYPNLATVPPPPTEALTTAELDKLTQDLIADRANAKYTSEHLEAQSGEAAAPPPPPPAPAAGAATPGASSPVAPASVPPGTAPAKAAPTAPPKGPGGGAAAAPSAMAQPAAKGTRKSGQPPEPGPMESSLQSPQIASLPQPQQNQPAPPPPSELSVPSAPGAPARAAHLPPPPAPEPMPAALGSAKFQPAPPPPTLAPAAPIRTATANPAGKPPKPEPPPLAFTKVADIAFPGDETKLSDADRHALGKVLPRYRAKPGQVRVVGYAGIGASATEQLNSYRTALDRAQAVATALAQAGIPSNKITAEAAPTGASSGPGRAEILFEQ